MIILDQKGKNNERLLTIENINKILIVQIIIVSRVINLDNKHSWAINNISLNVTRDLKLTNIKKY